MFPLNNELESCWCQKSTEHIKIILQPKFEMERFYGRYFMALWFFNKVVWIVLAAMLEGKLLPSMAWRPKLLFAYILVNVW